MPRRARQCTGRESCELNHQDRLHRPAWDARGHGDRERTGHHRHLEHLAAFSESPGAAWPLSAGIKTLWGLPMRTRTCGDSVCGGRPRGSRRSRGRRPCGLPTLGPLHPAEVNNPRVTVGASWPPGQTSSPPVPASPAAASHHGHGHHATYGCTLSTVPIYTVPSSRYTIRAALKGAFFGALGPPSQMRRT